MANFTSSLGSRLAGYERSVRSFVRRVLLDFGRRFRARMNRERIGGNGSVLNVKTGKLKRSFRYELVATPSGFRLDAQIGGGPAPYAEDHEDRGRLEFENTFQQEAQTALSEIRTGMEFFARNPEGGPPGGGAGLAEDLGGGDSTSGALLSEFRSHFEAKRAAAKLRRQSRWRSLRKGA